MQFFFFFFFLTLAENMVIIHAKNESNLGLGSRFAPPSYTHSSSSSSLVKLQKRVTAVCIQKPYITPPPLRTITNPIDHLI